MRKLVAWLPVFVAAFVVGLLGGMYLRERNGVRVLEYMHAINPAIEQYRNAFEVAYEVGDPRLVDGIRQMEDAREALAAIERPRQVRKLSRLALEAMDAGIQGHWLLRIGGDEAVARELLDLSVSVASAMAATAHRLEDLYRGAGQ